MFYPISILKDELGKYEEKLKNIDDSTDDILVFVIKIRITELKSAIEFLRG